MPELLLVFTLLLFGGWLDGALGVMADFILDARTVFARSHGHCCCCGKGLRDELSRARGIGPECVRFLNWLAFEKAERNGLVNAV